MPALRKGVGCLPMVRPVRNQPIEDTPWLRASFQVRRLLVVFTEGRDLCSYEQGELTWNL